MNVFVLDMDLQKCAEYHTDKHVVKMITETAQLLSSAYYSTNEEIIAPYRLSHYNHPWAKWARETVSNWWWLSCLGLALYDEYQYRYGDRHHRAGDLIIYMRQFPPSVPIGYLTLMPLCMPAECKIGNVVESYREYYKKYKQDIFSWKGRDKPFWIEGS